MSRFDFCALWVCCVWRQTAVGRLTVRIHTAPTARSKPEGDRGLPLTGLPSLARGSCVLAGVARGAESAAMTKVLGFTEALIIIYRRIAHSTIDWNIGSQSMQTQFDQRAKSPVL